MKTRGRPFTKGNPGKPKGARHKTTLAVETLLEGEAESLTRTAIKLALAGDVVALRLCLDRIAPIRKGRPAVVDLPQIDNVADLIPAIEMIIRCVSTGELTQEEGNGIADLIDLKRKAIETVVIEARLAAIERRIQSNE